MLRSFRLANHRSFRDETELLLLPVDDDSATLPVAAIFGSNASGKSNLLGALAFMAQAVRDSYAQWRPDQGIPRRPFLLDRGSAQKPSTFAVDVLIDEVRHVYGFSVDDERVLEEWLYVYPLRRRRLIFERHGSEVSLGQALGDKRGRADILRELTRPNALFLSLSAQLGQADMLLPYRWFVDRLRFTDSMPSRLRSIQMQVVNFVAEEPRRLRQLVELLRAADLGLRDMVVDDAEHDVEYDNDHQPVGRVMLTPPGLRFIHGQDSELALRDESAGTVRWLWLLLDMLSCLENGGTVVVDELDASLHPELTARLVGVFRDRTSNPHGAQLIFTTHDATLLGTAAGEEILGRDHVWFVEKDSQGASKLYPLTDFHPRRTGENRERRYLGGSYGGLPLLSADDFAAAVRRQGGADGRAS